MVGGGLIVVAFVVLAITYPRVSLLTLVALDVSNINGVIADQLGTSPYKPQLALAVVVVLVMMRRRMFRFAWSPVLLGAMVLFAGFCVSFVAAADPLTSLDLLSSQARDLLYFVVVYALVLSTDQVKPTAAVAVLVLAALAGLTVVHEFVLHNQGSLGGLSRVPLVQEDGALTPRHAGTSSDVNFWGRLLILFTPMSLSLLAMSKSWRDRVLWGGATVSLMLGVYLTQSRGGFIALFIGLVMWAVLAGGAYRKALLYLPVALIVIVPLTGIGSRLGTLTAVVSGSTTTADPSVVTRKRFQLDAWHMFLDRPITGHGIGSYGGLFAEYDRLANFYEPVNIVVAAHNFYLEQAADGGVVLLICWAFFFGTILFVALRTMIGAGRTGDDTRRFLALGVIGGLIGWLIASVFLHLSDFRALLLIAVIAAAVDVQSRAAIDRRGIAPEPEPGPWRPGRGVVAGLAVMAALSLLGTVAVLTNRTTVYTSTTALGIVPSGAVNPASAYSLDLITRGLIGPTFTEVLSRSVDATAVTQRAGPGGADSADRADSADSADGADRADVEIAFAQSRLGGGVVLTVTADDSDAATELTAAAVAASKGRIADLDTGYQLIGDPAQPQPVSSPEWWWLPALALSTIGCAALAVITGRRRRALRPADPDRGPAGTADRAEQTRVPALAAR